MATVELDYDQAMHLSETLKSFSAREGIQATTFSRSQQVLANYTSPSFLLCPDCNVLSVGALFLLNNGQQTKISNPRH